MLRRRHGDDLVVHEAKEVFDHLQLRLNAFHAALDIIESLEGDAAECQRFFSCSGFVVSSVNSADPLRLTQLILDCLAVDRAQR
jgi:hypothetical protein